MPPSRRALLIGLGGLFASSGALVGASAFQNSVDADGDMRVVVQGGFLELDVGPGADEDEVVAEPNGELNIDFARSAGSAGVQPDATYQLGGIDVAGDPNVSEPLQADTVAQTSGYPAPIGGGTAQNDAAIILRNNSNETIGVTVDFAPNSNFPSDGRVLIVMHDKGQAVGGTDVHAKLFGPNGLISSSTNSAEHRAVFSGEELGISIWIYTGTDETADMSGTLTFSGDDADDLSNVGDTGSGGFTGSIGSVSLAQGQGGNDIDVTVSNISTNDPGAQLRIQSLWPASNPNTIRDEITVSAADGTYTVLGANQADRVRVILLSGNGTQLDSVTTAWSP